MLNTLIPKLIMIIWKERRIFNAEIINANDPIMIVTSECAQDVVSHIIAADTVKNMIGMSFSIKYNVI